MRLEKSWVSQIRGTQHKATQEKALLQSMLVVPNTKPSAVKAAGAVKTAKALKT